MPCSTKLYLLRHSFILDDRRKSWIPQDLQKLDSTTYEETIRASMCKRSELVRSAQINPCQIRMAYFKRETCRATQAPSVCEENHLRSLTQSPSRSCLAIYSSPRNYLEPTDGQSRHQSLASVSGLLYATKNTLWYCTALVFHQDSPITKRCNSILKPPVPPNICKSIHFEPSFVSLQLFPYDHI